MSAQEVNKNEETGFGDEFKKVESRKRKADEKMDDRPYFEPIAADKMGSKKKGAPDVRRGISYVYFLIFANHNYSSNSNK